MPTYVTLTKFPSEILRNLKDFPALLEEACQKAEAATGCRIVATWLTLGHGPYDHIGVLDAPDEAAIVHWVNIGVSASGVDSTIVRVFDLQEAGALLGRGA
jgi:uncharacterized protein with GYD domain